MFEIERKFLVNKKLWKSQVKSGFSELTQGYLYSSKEKTIRIRIKDAQAFITIKGPTKGLKRLEYEYAIPKSEALEMIAGLQLKVLTKKRYYMVHENKTWEVDVFEKELEGVILAEIELESETEQVVLPEWVGEEVSYNPEYYNANLINRLS